MVAKKTFFKNPILLIDFFHSQNIWKRQSGRQVMKIAFFHLNCCSTREHSISGLNLQGFFAVLTSRFGGLGVQQQKIQNLPTPLHFTHIKSNGELKTLIQYISNLPALHWKITTAAFSYVCSLS